MSPINIILRNLAKVFKLVPELKPHYDIYQLLLFHLQDKYIKQFFELIPDSLPLLKHTFKIFLNTLNSHQNYTANSIDQPYSNAKLEATNKLIKHNNFGYKIFDNFKIALT
ncbi:transposase [Streptococcus suis]|nr:transposase [Streptococcus suis]NQP64928.1 transposase [Streptococcus suis]